MSNDREDSLEARRRQLGAELANRQATAAENDAKEAKADASRKGFAEAMKLSSEFISAIIVGAILGYLFDRFLSTSPWGLIVFLLIGFCAGVLNVLRAAGKVASPHPADRRAELNNRNGDGR